MITGLIVLLELLVLYLLSSSVTGKLYELFLRIFRERSWAISLTTLILFPGTVIHELSHLFTAEILRVPTGKLTLVPESLQTEDIRVGSVAVAQTDPFRRALIGLAPLFVGLVGLSALSYYFSILWQEVINNALPLFTDQPFYISLIVLYLLFTISNSLFPSSVDLKGTPALVITLFICIIGAYLLGLRIALTGEALEVVLTILSSVAQSLAVVLALNGGILIITKILLAVTRKS